MRVYADLFFLLNAGADLTLLAVAGRLGGRTLRPWRLLAGAAFGGAYGLAAVLLPWPPAFSPAGAALAATAMVLIAYAPVPARVLLRLLAFFYGAAALLGGLTLLLALRGDGAAGLTAGVPWWAFAAALGCCLLAGAFAWDRWRPEARARWICDLEVGLEGRRTACRALIDTGHHLRDPWGDGPAVLVDAAVLRGLLPGALLTCLRGDAAGLPEALAEVSAAAEPGGWSRRLRLIPFRTVGARGLLCGLVPDELRVRTRGRWIRVHAVLGVSPEPLDPEAGYRALVPACLVAAEVGQGPR